jgi:hypothetical protein
LKKQLGHLNRPTDFVVYSLAQFIAIAMMSVGLWPVLSHLSFNRWVLVITAMMLLAVVSLIWAWRLKSPLKLLAKIMRRIAEGRIYDLHSPGQLGSGEVAQLMGLVHALLKALQHVINQARLAQRRLNREVIQLKKQLLSFGRLNLRYADALRQAKNLIKKDKIDRQNDSSAQLNLDRMMLRLELDLKSLEPKLQQLHQHYVAADTYKTIQDIRRQIGEIQSLNRSRYIAWEKLDYILQSTLDLGAETLKAIDPIQQQTEAIALQEHKLEEALTYFKTEDGIIKTER